MSGESYTRWRSASSDDDEDDGAGEGGTRGTGGEGRVSVTTVAASTTPPLASPAAQARIVCVMVLVCVLCVMVGVWVGWAWGQTAPIHPVQLLVPAPPPDQSLAHRLLYNLKPNHIHDYMRKLSETPGDLLLTYIESAWQAQGLTTTTTSFTVEVSRQLPSSLVVTSTSGQDTVIYPPPSPAHAHAHAPDPPLGIASGQGTATGVVVYGHYGRRKDLTTLQALGVTLRGAILLLRHARLHPGAKLHNAEQAGAAGVLFYPDPEQFRGPHGGGAAYPEGLGLPDDGVVWESLSTQPGDPTTPCLPSLPHVFRQHDQTTPTLPGLSVSMGVAEQLMALMGGPGLPEEWVGALPLPYHLGGSWRPSANVTNITMTVNKSKTREIITNIHATLPAVDETNVVMVGSHYRSGDQVSPQAGLAALLALSDAMASSYLPRGTGRKVVFSAWAATEHGMIGSTEFTQLQSWWVEQSVMAYLSLDEVAQGTGSLRVTASPVLRQAIREAAQLVPWPAGKGMSVRDGWRLSDPPGENDVHFSSVGSGSDFVSFAAQRGVPVAHFLVVGEEWRRTYSLRHSQYDTYQAYTRQLDPGLIWTHMITSVVGAVTVVVAQSEAPPLVMSEVSGEVYNAWHGFLHTHGRTLARSAYNFTTILDAIKNELLMMQERLTGLDDWYQARRYYLRTLTPQTRPHDHTRQVAGRVWWWGGLERGLLGPRGVARAFTTQVMVGPDPENPYRALHFPHVTRAITRALQQHTPWETVHLELSYILAALASYRQLFPSDLPADPNYSL